LVHLVGFTIEIILWCMALWTSNLWYLSTLIPKQLNQLNICCTLIHGLLCVCLHVCVCVYMCFFFTFSTLCIIDMYCSYILYHLYLYLYLYSFIHSIGMCRMRQSLAILRSFFHSCLLCTFSCHPSPPTILPSSLTSSCHLFLGLPLNLVVPKFIYNTLSGILFPSILCTCPNQHYLFNLIVSIIVGISSTCVNFFIG